MDLLDRVQDYIQRYSLLQPGQRLLVGVSGGADSLALLDVLSELGYRPVVAHLDHRLRSRSWQDAQFVLRHAGQLRLPAVVGRREVRRARRPGQSLEETAREVRYRFLHEEAAARGLDVVAVAHTADDQAETILMHLLRGAGPAGLRGMRPSAPLAEAAGLRSDERIRLVRPFLDVTRAETAAYCQSHRLRPRSDPSNQDPSYFRNRLRMHLLPVLETYNAGITSVLCRTGEVMAGEVEWIDAATEAAWREVTRPAGDQAVVFLHEPFAALSIGPQRAVFRKAVARLRPGLRDVSFEAVERGVQFIAKEPAARRAATAGSLELINLSNEIVLRVPGGLVEFPSMPQLLSEKPTRMRRGQQVALADGWIVTMNERRRTAAHAGRRRPAGSRNEIEVDADRIRGRLWLQPPHPGDRIRILGSEGVTKISDLFVNAHVPWLARRRWPILVDEERVVWVAGLRMSHDCRLTASSRRSLVVRLVPPVREAG